MRVSVVHLKPIKIQEIILCCNYLTHKNRIPLIVIVNKSHVIKHISLKRIMT